MVGEAEANRGEDQALREAVDARNELDTAAYQVERSLTELGDSAPEHEKARARMLVTDARQAVKDEADPARARSLTSELQQVYAALAARQAGPAPGTGDGGGDGQKSGTEDDARSRDADDDVIDAEFDKS